MTADPSRRRRETAGRSVLPALRRLVWLYPIALGVGSWFPDPGEEIDPVPWLGDTWALTDGTDIALNLLLYAPLGAIVAARLPGSQRRRILLTAGAGFGLSLALELGQLAVPGRVTALSDLLLNTLGAVAGAVVYRAWEARIAGWATAPRRRWRNRGERLGAGASSVTCCRVTDRGRD